MDISTLAILGIRAALLTSLAAGCALMLWLALKSERRPELQHSQEVRGHEGFVPARTLAGRLQYVAGLLSLATAAIHGLVIQEHLEEWWGYGVFFIAATVIQGLYGFWLVGALHGPKDTPHRASFLDDRRLSSFVVWAGILGNVAVVALYVVTRTVGIPYFGPEAGEVEPLTLISAMSKLFEVGLIACLLLYQLRVAPNRRVAAPEAAVR